MVSDPIFLKHLSGCKDSDWRTFVPRGHGHSPENPVCTRHSYPTRCRRNCARRWRSCTASLRSMRG